MPDRSLEDSSPAAGSRSRFLGKVVLVTGASDRGIGGAIAEMLVEEGASVFLTSLEKPDRLLKRLQRRGGRSKFAQADLCQADSGRQLVEQCIAEFGRLDVLINNAGVEFAKPIATVTDEEWEGLLQINLHGAIRMVRAALPKLSTPGGVILNVASALGLGGCPGFSIYSASKAGLIGFTQSLAWELAPQGIRVLGVAPALVATPMTTKHLEHLTSQARENIQFHHPLGVGSPHDVAAVVGFLVSDQARWLTGVTLPLGWAPHYPLPVDQFME